MKIISSILLGSLSALSAFAQNPASPPAIPQTLTPLPPSAPTPSPALYPLERAHLYEPFWKSKTVYGEAVVLKREPNNDPIYGTLLFSPERILSVRSSDETIAYEEGKDYTIDATNRRLVLTPDSRIPWIDDSHLYLKKGDPHGRPYKVGDPNTYLRYVERGFPKYQVVVDYVRAEPWTGIVPTFAGALLPNTIAKLKAKEGLRITVTGDSISSGGNASNQVPPYSPNFCILTQRGLEQAYGGDVTLTNLSVGGTTSREGLLKIPDIVKTQPDLVIVAFGMNDTARRDAPAFASRVQGIISGIHAALPKTEFILVSTCVANPEWNWSPADQFPIYRDALKTLTGPGIAVADVTQLWTDILARKRYLDLTGNGLNHPNDYGHHLYAQFLLAMLVDNGANAAASNFAPASPEENAKGITNQSP